MIINGRDIARELNDSLRHSITVQKERGKAVPQLTVFTCAPTFATEKFLSIKAQCAEMIGIPINVIDLSRDATTEDVVMAIRESVSTSDGVIVQLPFPAHIDVERVLAAIPETHDIDAIGSEAVHSLQHDRAKVLPPVVATISELVRRYDVSLVGKHAVVVGHGRLVGGPAAVWLAHQGARVDVIERETNDVVMFTEAADVLVLGAGAPGIITKHMIKEGVALFDAGTSEEGGKLVGDADPECAQRAALFTPVPGGIGPITVSMIFKNLLTLAGTHDPQEN